jgi:nitrite reductase (NADH) small subunit
MSWVRITAAENIPPREGRSVQLGALNVAIFNTGEGFRAVENRCPHGGGPLADGIVGGATVTCPLHNWRVCLESGAVERPCESAASAVSTFPIEVVDGIVMLSLDRARIAAA